MQLMTLARYDRDGSVWSPRLEQLQLLEVGVGCFNIFRENSGSSGRIVLGALPYMDNRE